MWRAFTQIASSVIVRRKRHYMYAWSISPVAIALAARDKCFPLGGPPLKQKNASAFRQLGTDRQRVAGQLHLGCDSKGFELVLDPFASSIHRKESVVSLWGNTWKPLSKPQNFVTYPLKLNLKEMWDFLVPRYIGIGNIPVEGNRVVNLTFPCISCVRNLNHNHEEYT